ncbi:MAG: transglutaminase-like domain-containing protein [Planctomycetota bacterium]|jgi:hypothetical protein
MTPAALALVLLTTFSPPSGRPPLAPLERYEPRLYDLVYDVSLATTQQIYALDRQRYTLADAPIVMPVILQNTFSRVDPDSLTAHLWLGGQEDRTLRQRTRLDDGLPFNARLAVLPIPRFNGMELRWNLGFRVQVWNSRIRDEDAMARIAWPREWPREVQDGLKPELYIESNAPLFQRAIEHVSQGQLRMVPPYLAAKDLLRYCTNEIQIQGDAVLRKDFGARNGLVVQGAARTAETSRGTPNDLVCVCVAMLRAAGIPARPVVGIMYDEDAKQPDPKWEFRTWGEFYMPDAGWIPFDPLEMRDGGARHLDVRRPWPGLGNMEHLNERIPLSFHFIPPKSVQSPQAPAVWGWDPRPGGDPSSSQVINFSVTDLGEVPDDEE